LRWVLVPGVLGGAVASGILLANQGSELFPPVDAGQVSVGIRLASGTRIEDTEARVAEIESVVQAELGERDLGMLISNLGVLMDWPAAYTPNTGPMDAFMLVQLQDRPDRRSVFEVVGALRARLPERFPEVEFTFDTGGLLTAALNLGEPAPIHLQVSGSNVQKARQIADEAAAVMRGVDGTADVRVAQRLDYPILDIQVDRVRAGLAPQPLGDHPHPRPFRHQPSEYHRGHRHLCQRVSGHDLGTVVSEIEAALGRSEILAVPDRDARGALMRVTGGAYQGQGYQVRVMGEVAGMREAFGQLEGGLGIALVLIFLVLVAMLRSIVDPLVILGVIPMALIGVTAALAWSGMPLSVPAFMGIIMTAGLVVEYAIVLVDFANQRLAQGASVRDAVVEAATIRLRPIVMTSLTAALAVVPMAFGMGGGAGNEPLARVIIGGVLAAMGLTLFVVPCLYVMVKREPRGASPVAAQEAVV
jgi:multidrug efflux pump subunit AcrB